MTERAGRPDDVDTGFWLWMVALPLMVIGYVVELVTVPASGPAELVYGVPAVFLAVATSATVAFLLLMRQGYRWTRTLLSGGGTATIVYAVTNLFVERPAAAAMLYAAAAITGSVCIAAGVFLLHRKDAHAFFVR